MASGYDTARLKSFFDEGFVCAICLGVLKDPMQCENNEHYFCSGCIKEHLEKTSHTCPVCQDKLTVETLRKAPRIVEDCVSRYKIACDHEGRGCAAVLEIGALQAHIRDCGFTPVSCSNDGCDDVVNKQDVKQHETELCRYKTTTCVDCGERMTYHKYGAHGCVLRRDVDEMKKDLADVKITQNEMMNEMRESMKRMTTAIEKLEKSCQNVNSAIEFLIPDIVVIAGKESKTQKLLSSVERFNLFNQTWTPLPELKIARWRNATVVFENQLLVCGGFTAEAANEATDSIEVLHLSRHPSEWKTFSVNLPIKVGNHKCVVHGNHLLIIGGFDGRVIFDTIYELLLVPPYSSKLLCHMRKKRCAHGVEIFYDKVLIAGGIRAKTDVEIFDIKRNQCVEMPPLPSPVYHISTVRRDETMLLIGGRGKNNKHSNEIIEYDSKTGQSKVLLVMEKERTACSAALHENTLVVIGGAVDDANAVDCFNFLSNSWRKLPHLARGRHSASAVVVNKNFGF
ncbi:kelch-like protein 5 [Dendronephthya gigantea]|uniref:kelch-like protein 5 n=1 Tax=Dendronephthya gigantea TaxID=151771 RepID=UPI00106A4A07|nr:kelch-like protein 5 [Dendronephthya gigantea]